MCLAVPAKILSLLEANRAIADMNGVEKEIDVSLTPDVKVNAWVIVHVGFALNVIDEAEAQKTLRLLASTGEAHE